MAADSPNLADFILGRRSARRAVLEALFADASARVHLRELARRTGYSAPMVAKAMKPLVEQGVVVEDRAGNARLFQANPRHRLGREIDRINLRVERQSTRSRAPAPAAGRRPASLREAAAWGAKAGRRDAMLRELLDEFYVAPRDRRAAMLADEPPLLAADDRANAYYAAVAEHLALTHGLEVPEWALDERRFLRKPFFPAGLESLKATLLVESPPAFRRRMIFVGADPLSRPRRERTARASR